MSAASEARPAFTADEIAAAEAALEPVLARFAAAVIVRKAAEREAAQAEARKADAA